MSYFAPKRTLPGNVLRVPKNLPLLIEFCPEKRAGERREHSCERSQSARSAAEIWLRASQFCGALRCPVSFTVAPPGPGTIYRGPKLNGPRTKCHYISEKIPLFATAIAKGGPNDVVTHVPSHTADCPGNLGQSSLSENRTIRGFVSTSFVSTHSRRFLSCRSTCLCGNLIAELWRTEIRHT